MEVLNPTLSLVLNHYNYSAVSVNMNITLWHRYSPVDRFYRSDRWHCACYWDHNKGYHDCYDDQR